MVSDLLKMVMGGMTLIVEGVRGACLQYHIFLIKSHGVLQITNHINGEIGTTLPQIKVNLDVYYIEGALVRKNIIVLLFCFNPIALRRAKTLWTLTFRVPKMKKGEFANRIDPDGMAHN